MNKPNLNTPITEKGTYYFLSENIGIDWERYARDLDKYIQEELASDDTFIPDGYHHEEPTLEIQVSKDLKSLRLFNCLPKFLSVWITVNGSIIMNMGRIYLIQDFIPYRKSLEKLQDLVSSKSRFENNFKP